ncbi:MAG: hypothetical protein WCJ02_12015 [bacterium]
MTGHDKNSFSTRTAAIRIIDRLWSMARISAVAFSICASVSSLAAAEKNTDVTFPTPEKLRLLRSTHTAVSAQNPYLPLAIEAQKAAWPRVRAGIQKPGAKVTISPKDDDPSLLSANDTFWVVWSAFAPEGPHRADEQRCKEARDVLELWTTSLEKHRLPLWGILQALEAVDIAYAASRDVQSLKRWMGRLRASVEANYNSNHEPKNWPAWTPNPLIQSTPILALGSKLAAAADPADEASARWQAMARECLRRALPLQLPGGAFSYVADSGSDPNYYELDSTFLGRYWLVTGDPDALAALQRMAGSSRSATLSGKLDASASPVWKHYWQIILPGLAVHAPEIIATLSGDPVTKAVANRRLMNADVAGTSSVYYMYYALRCWDADVPAQPLDQRCEFDLNANGPALRSGPFDVIMPARPYTDATFSASIASAKRFEAFLSSTRLALYPAGKPNLPPGSGTFCMTYSDDVPRHASIVGEGWIAAGWHFTPRPNGNRENAQVGPADRTDLWFADAAGAGGVVSLQVRETTKPMEPTGWLMLSSMPESLSNAPSLKVGPLYLELGGDFAEKQFVDQPGPPQPMVGLKLSLKDSKPQSWQPETRFYYSLTAWPEGGRKWAIEAPRGKGGIVQISLQRERAKRVLLVYNSNRVPTTWLPDEDVAKAWMSLTKGVGVPAQVAKGRPIVIPAYSLLVCERELKE